MSMTKNLLENIQKNITESEDLDKCINDYSQYVDSHIQNVQKAWLEQVSTLDDDFIKENYDELTKQIEKHDLSKWGEEEFDAYRANYNPVNDEEKTANEANFQAAWYHHFRNNPHHWQYWTDESGELVPMTDLAEVKKAYIEMICDWQAMGYVFGDTANQYYNSNKDTIKLYPELREWVEGLLQELDDKFIKEENQDE